MKNLVDCINKGLAFFTICLSTFLVFCVTWQVVSRYVLGTPSTVTDEFARYLFMWVAMIGAAYTTGQHRHLAIDLLAMKLKGVGKNIVGLVIQTLIALFASVVLVYGGSVLAISTLETGQITPALGLQMGYVYLCLPISGVLIIFYALVDSVALIQNFSGKDTTISEND
ncbi:TRAP transporter small permease [Photorhabdus heterorhabditis]|uniref:TRAP transporter small permease protein n=1 Tax=Photorhabdus heterorhabditis TaxID=880156 RepID=A0A5B0WNQ9_9GAMM|nr:TRAP transporter small permease [Photorhabdus heterorhabditis]KAA1187885.1 TRAP transporter small permease [Photorhabdus heterorhabditis]KOY63251.1 C4-dicarboxylate ABC transporter permease [Photorhabdus heterorhabditis]MBS9440195.1 TRAP transporter small permease [Photorhabdus heterorhabditis]NRN29889.1 TRAP transporter small permease [Photorhabdus heterorhabditis subsp. aluminescens]